jgi:hypothetical protein
VRPKWLHLEFWDPGSGKKRGISGQFGYKNENRKALDGWINIMKAFYSNFTKSILQNLK